MSEGWRDSGEAKRTPWHSGCDVSLRQRDCAPKRDRISHTRDGA